MQQDIPSIIGINYKQKVYRGAALLAFFIFLTSGLAQRPSYKISAILDTSSHTLSGVVNITYFNHSDQPLDSLGVHLWPEAFESNRSALVKQMLNLGNLELYRAKDADKGGFSDLKFTSPQQPITLEID